MSDNPELAMADLAMPNSSNMDAVPVQDDEIIQEHEKLIPVHQLTSSRIWWCRYVGFITFWIPDCLLKRRLNNDIDRMQAWREKVGIVMLMLFCSAILLYTCVILPKQLCPDVHILTYKEIYKNGGQIMILNGKVLDVSEYMSHHPSKINLFAKFLGQDVGFMFRRKDPYQDKPENFRVYPDIAELYLGRKKNDTDCYCANTFCHDFMNYTDYAHMVKGDLILTYPDIVDDHELKWVIINDNVYNMTEYIKYGHGVYPSKYDYVTQRKEMAYFMDERLNITIMSRIGANATDLFQENFEERDRAGVLRYIDQYYIGKFDLTVNPICEVLNIIYLIIASIIAGIIVIMFLVVLCTLRQSYPKCDTKHTIVFVPCYTESEKKMKNTIYSIFDAEYLDCDNKKLLVAVCDGVIQGKGNLKSTAEITLNIFGRSLNDENESYEYESLGSDEKSRNRAKIFYGSHTSRNRTLPYIIIVKVGNEKEVGSDKPGNRGKRDSQVLLFRWLNKVHRMVDGDIDDPPVLNEFEKALYENITKDNTFNIVQYEYLLSVDADTVIRPNAMLQLVYHMSNKKIIGLCGQTEIANKRESIITVIQPYEYYLSHTLIKSFQSMFSNVTCLPGCFTILRLYTRDDEENDRKILLALSTELLEEYSDNNVNTLHKRNLLDLGEDRFFTTLLIKYFPEMQTKYTAAAKCETNVPSTLGVLVSQRRRWNNSTLHNLIELIKLGRLCGFCCFSMKFLIIMEIIVAMTLPTMSCYFLYLIYLFVFHIEHIPLVFIIVTGAAVGVQILVPIIKRDIEQLIWFIIYVPSFPFWYIVLPIYSAWRNDDFSWGSTHKISKKKKNMNVLETV
jgi:chitin synthase